MKIQPTYFATVRYGTVEINFLFLNLVKNFAVKFGPCSSRDTARNPFYEETRTKLA